MIRFPPFASSCARSASTCCPEITARACARSPTSGRKDVFLGALVSLGFLFLATPAFAQGIVYGVVSDSLTGETLPGAHVFLLGTARGSATDVEGAYRISGIPAGTHTMRISYLGYETREVALSVADDQTLRHDITLTPYTLQGDEVVVTAQAEGQAAAVNQQLTANTIVNVISEEKIQALPDANAAEAIGRLPGVAVQRSGGEAHKIVLRGLSDTFSSITIDGVRIAATDAEARGVDLSTISQGSLAGIELYKALTPDKDADAIAGSVNLVTRKAPAERLIRFDARGAYNDLNTTLGQYDVLFRFGDRFFNDALGVQLTGNLEQRDRSKENFDLSYDLGLASGTDYEITDIQLLFTDETRSRQGASFLLDLNTPDGGSVRFNNNYNQTGRDFVDYHRNYPTDGDELFYGARNREQDIYTLSSALRGENYLFGLTGTWGASYAYSKSDYPFDFDINFTEPSVTDAEGNPVAGMQRIPTDLQKGPPETISDYALNNFQRAYFYTAFYRQEENTEEELTAFLDLAKEYSLGPAVAGAFKVGGKYRQKTRRRDRSELLSPYYNEAFPRYVIGEDGTIREKTFAGTPFEGLDMVGDRILVTNLLDTVPVDRDIFDSFNLYPLLNRDLMRSWWNLNRNGFSDANGRDPEFERNREADAFFYDIAERVSAGYVMNTLHAGRRLTLLAGLRVEHENNEYDSRYSPNDLSGFPVPTGAIRDTAATHRETVWLPNAHLTVRPTDFLSIRLAAYKALARPNFNQRLASFVARKAGTFYPGNSLFVGNPDLKAAEAWNYEVNTSVYSNKIGLVSVSVFYKDIQHMYHLIDGAFFNAASADSLFGDLGINAVNPFETQGFALTYPFNSSRPTRVWGVEFEHQANLLFLPGLLRHFVLSYNLSLVRSETYIPGTDTEEFFIERPPLPPIPQLRYLFVEREQKLEGQPELLGNVSIGYDIGGFSARLSVFHQGEYNARFSPNGRDDRVVNGFTRWDLALKQQVFNNLFLMLNLNNFTGVKEGTTVLNRVQGWHLLNDSETYGFTADFGVRLTL